MFISRFPTTSNGNQNTRTCTSPRARQAASCPVRHTHRNRYPKKEKKTPTLRSPPRSVCQSNANTVILLCGRVYFLCSPGFHRCHLSRPLLSAPRLSYRTTTHNERDEFMHQFVLYVNFTFAQFFPSTVFTIYIC